MTNRLHNLSSIPLQGYYAVALSPPQNLRCEERRSAWAAWYPGMEIELEEHFCPSSTPRRAVKVLNNLCSKMRQEANSEEEATVRKKSLLFFLEFLK
jgi:hypothetical protein